MTTYKPQGYSSVSPYLVVGNASRTIEFLINSFDGTELRRFSAESGQLVHAEVRVDDTVIMLADSTESKSPAPAQVHLYVPDVDATYQRALKAGAISIKEPKQDGEEKRAGVKDAGGVTWWIATVLN